MFHEKIQKIVSELVLEYGVEISVSSDQENKLYINLHTYAKSHMHLYEEGNEIIIKKRYGQEDRASLDETVDDLISFLAYNYTTCIHGRGFGSDAWDKVCANYNITVRYGDL